MSGNNRVLNEEENEGIMRFAAEGCGNGEQPRHHDMTLRHFAMPIEHLVFFPAYYTTILVLQNYFVVCKQKESVLTNRSKKIFFCVCVLGCFLYCVARRAISRFLIDPIGS